MVKRITLDSSLIVSSLLEKEPRHEEALEIWAAVLSGNYFAIMPYSVFVEVVAAIRRRTGSEKLAREVNPVRNSSRCDSNPSGALNPMFGLKGIWPGGSRGPF